MRTTRLAAPLAWLAVLALVSAGCKAAPLPILAEAPKFDLVADDGRPFVSDSLRGRVWLASFLYTSCPGPCPRLVEKLKRVRKEIPPAEIAFVSFSVDPDTDTPEVLRKYKAAHGIGADDAWTFVTGPAGDVIALVQKGFLTGVQRENAASPDEGSVSHGTRVALIDRDGHVRGFYSTEGENDDLERLVRDARSLD